MPRSWFARVCLFLGLLLAESTPARAQVVWEDYQGSVDILGSSNQDKAGPSYVNNGVNRMADLRAISANIANATRTGTSSSIDYDRNLPTLCNTVQSADASYDSAGTGPACQADAQGRVHYALVKFPETGNYSFSFAHDDDIDVDMSSDYTNTAYRTASYDLPVGSASSFTSSDTTFENIAGVYSSPSVNACILLRIYWNNGGGRNFLRMRWTKPSSVTEIIPASQLFNPGVAASSIGCTGTLSSAATSIQIKKTIAASGRAGATDQFAISLIDSTNGSTQASAQTSGATLQASTGTTSVVNARTYQVTEQIASGSSYTLGAYTPTIACTRDGTSFTPGGSAPTWTVATTALNQTLICTITNTRKGASLQLRKTWVGALINDAVTLPATTGFSANTTAFVSVANTASETDTGTAVSVLVGDSGTVGAESFTTGTASAYASVLDCTGATPSGSNGQAANTLVIPESAAGTAVVCTYTNTYRIPLAVTKTSALVSDPVFGATNPKAIPGAVVRYCVLITNPSSSAATSIAGVDALPASLSYVSGTLKSGASCAGAATTEDDDASGADETDPAGASAAGSTLTFTGTTLAAGDSLAFILHATVN